MEAKITTLKLNLTDEKIQWVADFFNHIPMPHSNSMMGLDDSVDGHLEPVLYAMAMVRQTICLHYIIYLIFSKNVYNLAKMLNK